jgi:hypothetical protein
LRAHLSGHFLVQSAQVGGGPLQGPLEAVSFLKDLVVFERLSLAVEVNLVDAVRRADGHTR